ncbi:tandem-95 repeat protein [Planctomycetaceae bacterium]|nr:tandem-95 repeat protein [Planctomycetaceae bacterium]
MRLHHWLVRFAQGRLRSGRLRRPGSTNRFGPYAEILEDRTLLTANVADQLASNSMTATASTVQQLATAEDNSNGQNLSSSIDMILINDQLDAADALERAAHHDAVVMQYDGTDFSTMAMLGLLESTLKHHQIQQIESLSLVTHGNAGSIHLAENTTWSIDTLESEAATFNQLGDLITEQGSFYLYSCSVTATVDGTLFVDHLAHLAGTTIHASDDQVGNTNGADWDWEYHAGNSTVDAEPVAHFDISALPAMSLLGDWYEMGIGYGNDTFESAAYLGAAPFEFSPQTIHSTDDHDWYGFWLDQDGTSADFIEITFSTVMGDLDIGLYDANRMLISSSESWTDNERISLAGLPGQKNYFLHVHGFLGASNTYDIRVQAQPHRYPGDWRETSTNTSILPRISNGLVFSWLSLHSPDDEDWYWFHLQDSATSLDGVAVLDFTSSNVDLDLVLYDWYGNLVTSSSESGDTESINFQGLPYGWYQIGVLAKDGSFSSPSFYSLVMDGPLPATTDRYEPNDGFASALDIGSDFSDIWDLYITAWDVDIFEFDMPSTGTLNDGVTISFEHEAGDLDLWIADENGIYLDGSLGVDDYEYITFWGLPEGTYFAVVAGATGFDVGEYKIHFDFPEPMSADAGEEDDDKAHATDLGNISGTSTIDSRSIHQPWDDDWYTFTLTEWGQSQDFVRIDFDHSYGDLSLELYYEYDIHPLDFSDGFSDVEMMSLKGYLPGTYYAVVSGLGDTSPQYSFTVTASAASRGPDRFEPNDVNPTILGTRVTNNSSRVLTKDVLLTDLTIHSSSDQDHFTFTTTTAGNATNHASISFDNNASDLELALYDSDWNLLDVSATTNEFESISLNNLGPGTYHLKVWDFLESVSESYSLQIASPKIPVLSADRLESNNSISTATSANSSTTNNLTELFSAGNLNIHNASDVDFFRFTTTEMGTHTDEIKVVYDPAFGDIDIQLVTVSGTVLRTGSDTSGVERINMLDLAQGTYFVKVMGKAGATNNYTISIDPPAHQDDWTVMVYMTASDLANYANHDINLYETLAADLPDSVNITVFWDQSTPIVEPRPNYSNQSYASPWIDDSGTLHSSTTWSDSGYALIQPDRTECNFEDVGSPGNCEIVTPFNRIGEQNSGDPITLANFVDWSVDTAPADNYWLMFWDHGSGLNGQNNDTPANDAIQAADSLHMHEITAALDTSGTHFEVISFNNCLMGVLEVAHELRDQADYIVGSQDVVYLKTFAFVESPIRELGRAAATTTGRDIATDLVKSFDAHRNQYFPDSDGRTLSAVDTSQLDAVATAVEQFSSNTTSFEQADWGELRSIAQNISPFFRNHTGFQRDAGKFFENVADAEQFSTALRDSARDVANAIDDAVIAKTNDPRSSSGVSTYLPTSFSHQYGDPGVDALEYATRFAAYDADTNWGATAAELVSLEPDFNLILDWLNNSSLVGSMQLGQLAGSNSFAAQYADQDNDRWYSIEMLEAGTSADELRVVPHSADADVTLGIYEVDNTLKTESSGTGDRAISLDGFDSGTYFVRVQFSEDTQQAFFDLEVVLPAQQSGLDSTVGNATQEKAHDLGGVSSISSFSGFQLPADQTDWFKFITPVFTGEMNYNLRIQVTSDDPVTGSIYDASGNVMSSASGDSTFDLPFEMSGNGGPWFIKMENTDSAASYNMTMSPQPTAVDDVYSTDEDAPLEVDSDLSVLSNDHDYSNDLLTVVLVESPEHGDIQWNSSGTFVYTPDAEFHGTDQFKYYFDDGLAPSSVADVTIDIIEVNDLPTIDSISALNIAADAGQQTVNISGISAGITESQPLRVTASSDRISLIPHPTVTYTSADATGTLSFTSITDRSGSAVLTVTVEDGGLDGDLSSTDDNATFSRSFGVSINKLPTLDSLLDVSIDEDASEQTINLTGIGAGGNEYQSLEVTTSSSNLALVPAPILTYTSADETGSLKFTPSSNQHGTTTITVTVEDSGFDQDLGATDDNATFTRTFDVVVNAVNDPPSALPDEFSISQDHQLTVAAVGVLENDSDLENDTLSAVLETDVSNGTLSFSSDGGFNYTPNAGFFGSDWFAYKATDGNDDSNSVDVTITVKNTVEIHGTLVHDLDGDGTRDAGEPGLSGWTVFLDTNSDGVFDDGELSTTTVDNERGNYSFIELPAGDYTVAWITPVGWQATAPSREVTLALGEIQQDLDLVDQFIVSATPTLTPAAASGGSQQAVSIRPNGTNVEVIVNGNLWLLEPATELDSISVNGSNDDDALIVDLDGRDVALGIGADLVFNGNGDGTDNDTLQIINGSASNITYSFDNATDGTITLDSSTIDFSGLDPIFDSLATDRRTFAFATTDDVVTLSDDGNSVSGLMTLSSVSSSGNVTFSNPDSSLSVFLGNGDDELTVVSLDDVFAGSLTLNGEGGNDTIDASAIDVATKQNGSGGDDRLTGGVGNDTLNGGSGADALVGGDGNDRLQGQGSSYDSLSGGAGDDTLDGGDGYDRISETADVDFTATDSTLTGLGNDTLINIQLVQLFGGSSANTIDTSAFTGRAFLNGSGGHDTLNGGGWYDRIFGGSGRDLITGGTSVIDPGPGTYTYDVLRGQGGNFDTLIGGAGNDKLNGGNGHDSLSGGGGNDVLTGESGNDTINGGAGTDRLYERGNVNMALTNSGLSGGLGNDGLASIETAYLKGGNGNNLLDASSFGGDVTIIGVGGDDTLKGGTGDDVINGRSGEDLITGGDGNDTLLGMRDADTLNGGAGDDWIDGGTQDDAISGWTGDDELFGRSGDDILVGGNGNDSLYGAAGNDILQGDDGKRITGHLYDDDRLDGGADDDSVRGGGGSDTMMDDSSEVDETFAYWAEWVDAV